MSAKKCCCCGLLSCFPCFSDKKSTLSAQCDSSENAPPPRTVITNPSPAATLTVESFHPLSSSASPSAAAPSQVNAPTVMQNASQPIAPSDAVPSSSRGIVTPSALIPTTSQTTAFPPNQPASSSTPSSLIPTASQIAASSPTQPPSSSTPSSSALNPTASQTTAFPPTQPPSSSTPSSSALIPTASQTIASPPTQSASSSTPSSSRLPKESDHAETIMEAAMELDKENVDVDFSGLISYISQLFDFIEEKEKEKEKKKKGNSPSKPEATRNYWPSSKFFFKLKDVLAEGIEGIKEVPTGDAMTITRDIVKRVGMAHLGAAGLIVVANILERYEAISTNKEACLSLLKEMDKLARHVNELRKRPELKESMVDSIREAIALIVEASLACCTQMTATKVSKFFSTTVNEEALAKFKTRLAETDTHMQRNFNLCLYDAIVRRQKPMELQYPEHPKDAVGIEDPLKEVIERLQMGSDKNAVAVMVHGFGGMGKTTLADAVFARLLNAEIEGYKYSYVRLFDTIASTPNIVELQKFIMKALKMGEEPKVEFQRYEEGQVQIESILEKEVVFIYIDNVLIRDEVQQRGDALEQLLPKNMGNAKKLRLLITARNKDAEGIIVRKKVKTECYAIQGLPEAGAAELFKNTLGDKLKQLDPSQIDELVKICGGVPKLLTVVAGFISSEENTLNAYRTVIKESKTNWKGKIGEDINFYVFAYENLPQTLQDPFLDICSFFVGWDWKTLSNIVEDSELEKLEKRGLVTKHAKYMTAKVHDVILAIGLQKTEGQRFRLTSANGIQEFLDQPAEDLRRVKGIWCRDNNDPIYIPAEKLELMSGSLRVLQLGGSIDVQGKCGSIFKELVLFSAGISHLPFDVSKLKRFEKLSYLRCKPEDLPNLSQMPSSLRLIDFELKSPAFKFTSNCLQQVRNLRVLRLANAHFKNLPRELGHVVNGLQELMFSGCKYLEELPESISTLGSLRTLEMTSCPGLKSLPEDFGSLNSLQMLELKQCESLKALPGSLGNLTSLQTLDVGNCESLKALPGSLGNLTSLQTLSVYNCGSLKALPGSLGNLTSLQTLDVYKCESLKALPGSLGKLRSLRRLSLVCCDSLETLPSSLEELSSLEYLVINCRNIQVLPSGIGKLTSLVSLYLRCSKLSSIPESIGQSKSLNTINLSARVKELPDGFCNLPSLTDCYMNDCLHLEKLPDRFGQLTHLRSLSLDRCESLKKLPESFSQLKCLEHLSLKDCAILEELCTDFKDLSSLRVLDVRNCRVLEGKWMDSMVKMKTLHNVKIGGSPLSEERWGEIEKQWDPSWLFAVYTGQGLSHKENIAKQLQPNFDSILTDRRGQPFHISDRPLNTPLLVMFDAAKRDPQKSFLFSFIKKNIDDIQINFEIVYFGNHFNELPEELLYRVLGHAPADSTAEALFQKVLSLDPQETSDISWRRSDMGFLTLSAKIVHDEKGDKYLSCWERLERESLEEFILEKCGRYLKLKQLVERPRESPIELLRELFKSGENESSLAFFKEGAPTQVGVHELKGKTILLDIRPANLSYDVPLQSLVEMYAEVKDKGIFDFEIITIPIIQYNVIWDTSKKFSSEVPWLVLQNPWQLTNATKFFLVEGCWEERPRGWKPGPRGWEQWPIGLDRWYPNIMRILQSNGTFAGQNPMGLLLMVNTWGIEAFPFTEEKSKELIKKEVEEIKNMPPLMFLLKHLDRVSEQVKRALHQQKIICLCTFNPKAFTDSIKILSTELKDNIEIIYIPKFGGDGSNRAPWTVQFTDTKTKCKDYWPLEQPKTLQVEMQKMFLLDLSEHEAMRFWARFHMLQQGMKEINDKDEQLNEIKMLLDSTTLRDIRLPGYLWMVIMDEDGNLITTRGEKFVKLFQMLQNDKAKNLIQRLVKGGKESRKETLVELEQWLNIDDVHSGSDLHEEGTPLNPAGPKSAEPSSTNDDSAESSATNDDSAESSATNDDSAKMQLSSASDDSAESSATNDDSTAQLSSGKPMVIQY